MFDLTFANLNPIQIEFVDFVHTILPTVRWPLIEHMKISFPIDTELASVFQMIEKGFGDSSLRTLELVLPEASGTQNQIKA